jgi:hypothetical protein
MRQNTEEKVFTKINKLFYKLLLENIFQRGKLNVKDKTNTAYTATRMVKVMDMGYVQNHSQQDKGLRWMSFHL